MDKKKNSASLLGDFGIQKKSFADIEKVFATFKKSDFQKKHDRERSEIVNRQLLELIQNAPEPAFLLSEVIDYVKRVDQENFLAHYTFTSFEIWLNQFSGLSPEENLHIRAKIVGKKIPRDSYQNMFPIGMGKIYEGTHFVTAHKSPDLDTTVASFWGWVDAFGARVSEGSHIWNVPGGPPGSQIEIDLIFKQMFGDGIFTHCAKKKTALTLTGNDLFNQENLVKKHREDTTIFDGRERNKKAIVITDDEGFYLGDWRNIDVEGVRQIIMLLNHCLRWLENHIHLNLISLFAKKDLTFDSILDFAQEIFGMKIKDSEPVQDYSKEQKEHFDQFLREVLSIEKGLETTFQEFGDAIGKMKVVQNPDADQIANSLKSSKVFDAKGKLLEDRPRIFEYLKKFIVGLHEAIQNIRIHLEKIDIALKIKTQVLGYSPQFVTVRADVEEMRSKMSGHQYLTVTYPDSGKFYPVGVVRDEDLRKKVLGTVSLRDFSNRDEMTIASYLEVISVIDHHKSSLNTFTPPLAIISDAQSSNCLVAEVAFQINDRYSHADMDEKALDAQMKEMEKTKNPRLQQRLLTIRQALQERKDFYIHPVREQAEYIHFLYGILDDTDLLMKVSMRDIECVVQLLNRLKSLSMKKQVKIITLDDIPRDENFSNQAAQRILQNDDMYSIYKKVYEYREKEVEKNIELAAKGEASNLFSDTKEQNGCCRVGQTKMFVRNQKAFEKQRTRLQKDWHDRSENVYVDKPEVDLYIHMISTIVGADEVYKGTGSGDYSHQDELWIWAAPSEVSIEHLKRFLNAFRVSPQLKDNSLEVEFLGSNSSDLEQVFKESFISSIPMKKNDQGIPIAVLKYRAGSLNSRKAMISPYLPVLSS